MSKKITLVTVLTSLLFVAPALLAFWLSSVDKRYDDVLDIYECPRDVCAADFNGDGISQRLIVNRESPSSVEGSVSVTRNNGQELLRLPYRHIDNTLRMHIGIRGGSTKTHLIIYDQLKGDGRTFNTVFEWDGEKMAQVPPSEDDQEVLYAMAARDDAGGFNKWVLFRISKTPVLLCYYSLFGVMLWKFRQSSFHLLPQNPPNRERDTTPTSIFGEERTKECYVKKLKAKIAFMGRTKSDGCGRLYKSPDALHRSPARP